MALNYLQTLNIGNGILLTFVQQQLLTFVKQILLTFVANDVKFEYKQLPYLVSEIILNELKIA